MSQIDITISIVSFKQTKDLIECLTSLLQHHQKIANKMEIIVIAYFFNEKEIASINQQFPNVHLIRSDAIRGYSENNNLALKMASGDYCCILNDDTLFIDNMLEKALEYFKENIDVACVSPILLNPDYSIQDVNYEALSPLFTIKGELIKLGSCFYGMNKGNIGRVYDNREITRIPGACVIIRRDVLHKIGYMDENLFLGPDDADLGKRIHDAGHIIKLVPQLKIIHKWRGGETGDITPAKVITTIVSEMQYYKKHYSIIWTYLFRAYYFIKYSFMLSCLYIHSWFHRSSQIEKQKREAFKNVIKYIMIYYDSKDVFVRLNKKYNLEIGQCNTKL
jgi:GT2 family glycosyltransferase